MTKYVVKISSYICTLVCLLAFFSCEKDIESVGEGIVNNENFVTGQYTSEVIAYNQNVIKNRAEALGQYLLGVYKDDDFGKLEASIITQLGLPSSSATLDFGLNPTIDEVILNIPFQSTRLDENYSNGTPKFKIDSLYGDSNVEYKIDVYKLGTFLNTLDPSDPTQRAKYYTDKDYIEGNLLYSNNFTPNAKDTVAYVDRIFTLPSGVEVIYDTDTIKNNSVSPSIKFRLDKDKIYNDFIVNPTTTDLSSNNNFRNYFKGLYIKSTPLADDDASIVSLNLASANMTIYYSTDLTTTESADEDLNFNGITGETGIVVKTPKSHSFSLSSIRTNKYIRDYSGSTIEPLIASPNDVDGEQNLFLQGAAGSEAVIELFKNEDIAALRANNWLINEANLIIYKNDLFGNEIAPERLFIYNKESNSQLLDIRTEGQGTVGGTIATDEDGAELDYYKFRITDLVSSFLDPTNSSTDTPKIGLKVYNPTDLPLNALDTIIKDYSWNPKHVVLKGNLPTTDEKRLKLEIFYSEAN